MGHSEARSTFLHAVDPAFALLPERMDSREARILMAAIAMQESRLVHRHQVGGPAHGLWQFERGGGVRGVLRHPASEDHAVRLCRRLNVEPTVDAVYDVLEFDDVLAAGFARLLLWTDAARLPRIGDPEGAWAYYLRNWRPGKPHLSTWPAMYRAALEIAA